ncbi:MAG: hypothetical protein V3T82_09275 [Nitrospinaceae bacterium]
MNELHIWAQRWGIPFEALGELPGILTPATSMPVGEKSEEAVKARVRLEASQKGILLWRNNVGVAQDPTGRVVRFGLANDSSKLNKEIKSADLIGLRPDTGQFIARETKRVDWSYRGSSPEKAQLKFLLIVQSKGGDACFAKGIGTL